MSNSTELQDPATKAFLNWWMKFAKPDASDRSIFTEGYKAGVAAASEPLRKALEEIAGEFTPGSERKTYDNPVSAMDRIRNTARQALAATTPATQEGGK